MLDQTSASFEAAGGGVVGAGVSAVGSGVASADMRTDRLTAGSLADAGPLHAGTCACA